MTPWVIMPFLGNVDQTRQAAADALTQSIPTRLLLINQGGPPLELDHPRCYHWRHEPPLPSLAATWNLGLQAAWDSGCDVAIVVNNDVRLPRELVEGLIQVQRITSAWFVTACNVGLEWPAVQDQPILPITDSLLQSRGGPDFSCFLITRECHTNYPFDPGFVPAYCEDLDYHRRLMLDGHGRTIFSVPIPYLHYACGTLREMGVEQRARKEDQITAGSRAHYRAKWGGDVNQEIYRVPFDAASVEGGITTPELQRAGGLP